MEGITVKRSAIGHPGKSGKIDLLYDQMFEGLPKESLVKMLENLERRVFDPNKVADLNRNFRVSDVNIISRLHGLLKAKVQNWNDVQKLDLGVESEIY